MERYCINCEHRGKDAPGCEFDRQVQPNPYEYCPLKPSRWSPKQLPPGGKLVVPYAVDPSPKQGILKGEPGDLDEGYSLACMGDAKYLVKNGKCYTCDDKKKYVGELKQVEHDMKLKNLGISPENASEKLLKLLDDSPELTTEENNGKEQTV